MKRLAITAIAALGVAFGAGFGVASAHQGPQSGPCHGKPGSIPYAFCALRVSYPNNAIICGKNIPTASNCEVFMDGDRPGKVYPKGRDLVYGP